MIKKYSIIVVDDELPARELMEEYIKKIPELFLMGSFCNAHDAITLLEKEEVDILLTDIQMPDIQGIEFVKNLHYQPAIIFTTAYSQYAIEGFNLDVVDYLLKPIAFQRFEKAIRKAMLRVDFVKYKASALLQNNDNEKDEINYILVKADHKLYKINLQELFFVQGQHEYVTFHTLNRNITAYYKLKDLEKELFSSGFVRIHKSYIISLKHIDCIENNAVIINGKTLPIGATYKKNLFQLIHNDIN